MRNASSEDAFQVGSKDELTLDLVGAAGHGKSTLAAALHRCLPLQDAGPGGCTPPQPHGLWSVDCQTPQRLYHLRDFPRAPYFATRLLQEGVGDGAVLVLSAAQGPNDETALQLRLARDLGLRYLVVFLSHADQVEDPELLQIATEDTRALLNHCGGLAESIPIVFGSAARALDGSPEHRECLLELIDTVDCTIPGPERQLPPFMVELHGVYRFRQHGTTLVGLLRQGRPWLEAATPSGRVRRIALKEVELLGLGFSQRVRVKSIVTRPSDTYLVHVDDLMAGSERDPRPGDLVWIVLGGVETGAIRPAKLAVLPGSTPWVDQVKVVVGVPYEPDFPHLGSLRSGAAVVRHEWDTPATLTLEAAREPLFAGDAARVEIEFETPIPLPARGFHIVQDGEYVAIGAASKPVL